MGWLKSLGNGFIPCIPFLSQSEFFLVNLIPGTCICIYNHDGVIIILTFYVDDLLVIGGDVKLIEQNQKQVDGLVQDD